MLKQIFIFYIVSLLFYFYPLNAMAYSLVEAQEDYLRGNYDSAINKAQKLREDAENLYFLGLAYVKTGNYSKARHYLNRLLQRFPYSDVYEKGFAKLADTYFLEKKYHDAKRMYKQILREARFKDARPVACLRLAQIASRKGDWEEKDKYVNLIKSRYPKSPEVGFAQMLGEWGNYFAIQVGAFSEKNNALSLKKQLESKYQTYITEDRDGQYPIYKVRVGKFKQRKQTENVARCLLESGYPAKIYP